MYSSNGDIEIGATLRKTREELGVTLDDIEDETKIRKRYLSALELEAYENLPSEMYARGFLKTYANYLGLDGEALSQELRNRSESNPEHQHRAESIDTETVRESKRSHRTGGASRSRRRISFLAMLGFVVALLLLAGAVFALYTMGQNSRSAQIAEDQQAGQKAANEAEPVKSGATTTSKSSTSQNTGETTGTTQEGGDSADEVEPAPSLPQDKILMTVTVEQVPAWLNLQTDDVVAYEQVSQPGFSQTFEAEERITVWTGNAGAIRLEINGQDYGALGAPGEVERRTFTLKPPES